MELLGAPKIEIYDNLSKKTCIRTCKDLTKHIKKHIVLVEELIFEDNNCIAKYGKFIHHTMIHDICLDRCLGWRILCNHLVYAKNMNVISECSSNEYDTYTMQSFSAGLQNCQYSNDM